MSSMGKGWRSPENCRIAFCSERGKKKREIKYLRGVAGFTSLYWLTCQVQRKHGRIYEPVHRVLHTKDFFFFLHEIHAHLFTGVLDFRLLL